MVTTEACHSVGLHTIIPLSTTLVLLAQRHVCILGQHCSTQFLIGTLFVSNGLLGQAKRTAISQRPLCIRHQLNLVKPTGEKCKRGVGATLHWVIESDFKRHVQICILA